MGKVSCRKVQVLNEPGKATRGAEVTLLNFDGGSSIQEASEITLGQGCYDGQVKSVIVANTKSGYYKLVDAPIRNGIFYTGVGNITLNLIWVESCKSWQVLDNIQDSKAPPLVTLDDCANPVVPVTKVARPDVKFINISTPDINKDQDPCDCDDIEQQHIVTVLYFENDCAWLDLICLNYVSGNGWTSSQIRQFLQMDLNVYPNQLLSSNGRYVIRHPESVEPLVQENLKVYTGATFATFDVEILVPLSGVLDSENDRIISVTINQNWTQVAALLKQLDGTKYANVYDVSSKILVQQYIAPLNGNPEPDIQYFFLYNGLAAFQNGDEVFVANPQTFMSHAGQYLKDLGENTNDLVSTSLVVAEEQHLHSRLPTSDATSIVSKKNTGLQLGVTGDGRYLHTVEAIDGLFSLNMHFKETDIYQCPHVLSLPGVQIGALAVSRSGEAVIFVNENDGLLYLVYPDLYY